MVKNIYHLVKKEVRTEKLRASASVKSRQTLLSLFFALTLLLSTLSPVFAEEPAPQPGVQPTPASPVVAEEQPVAPGTPGQNQNPMQNPSPEPKQTPAENPNPVPENPANDPDSHENQNPAIPSPNTPTPASPEEQNGAVPPEKEGDSNGDGLEISPEQAGPAVGAQKLPTPTSNEVRAGSQPTITGTAEGLNLVGFRRRVYAYTGDPTLSPTPNDVGKSSSVKNSGKFSIKVTTPLNKGDHIYLVLKQEKRVNRDWIPDPDFIDSDPLQVTVLSSMADEYDDKINVPKDTFLFENQFTFTDEAENEVLEAFRRDNQDIADKIKSLKLAPGGSETKIKATLTYADDSKSKAFDLTMALITERSATPLIEKGLVLTDTKIIGSFAQNVVEGTTVRILINLNDAEQNNVCEGGSCKFATKRNTPPIEANVDLLNGTFTLPLTADHLVLGQYIGIVVLEPKKLPSCIKLTPKLPTPKKTEVRDPRKLTEDDKKAIDAAIRKAYTRDDGVSKLPDWLAENIPAYIEFTNDENVRIINPANVEGKWKNYEIFIPDKNSDGSYKMRDGKEANIIIPLKDLVKNIKPNPPSIEVNTDEGKVTITPPDYKNPGDDTDLDSYTITYENTSNQTKSVTLTRTVDGTTGTSTWSADGVMIDPTTGVITLEIKDLAVGATITAIAQDKGGLEGDEAKLNSDPRRQMLDTVTVTYEADGGKGNMDPETLNKGTKYVLLNNAFTPPQNKAFKTWEVNGEEKAPGTEIKVDTDIVVKAIWQDDKPSPGKKVTVTYNSNGGSGAMDGATLKVGSTYKLQDNAFTAPKNKEFKTWLVNGKELAAGTEITVTKDTVIQAIWQDKTPSPNKPDGPSKPRRKFPFFKGKTELLRPHASVWPQDPQGNTPQRPLQNPSLQPNVPLQPGPTAHSPMLVPETGESKMPTTYAWVLLAVAGILILGKARIHKLG